MCVSPHILTIFFFISFSFHLLLSVCVPSFSGVRSKMALLWIFKTFSVYKFVQRIVSVTLVFVFFNNTPSTTSNGGEGCGERKLYAKTFPKHLVTVYLLPLFTDSVSSKFFNVFRLENNACKILIEYFRRKKIYVDCMDSRNGLPRV